MANSRTIDSVVRSVMGAASPARQVRNERLRDAALQVNPQVRKFISEHALKSQVTHKSHAQYYSTVRFQFVPVERQENGVSVVEYRLQNQLLRAFSYGTQESGQPAGFPSSYSITQAETNLVSRFDTGGAVVIITGMSFHLTATSDMGLAQLVWDNTFADITLDGNTQHSLIGRFDRVPQAGGLYGTGTSRVITPPLSQGVANVSTMTNGMPMRSNVLRLEPIQWNPASTSDSKFQVRFQIVRDITVRATARAEGVGIVAYKPPTAVGDPGTYVDVVVYLQTRSIAKRSTQT